MNEATVIRYHEIALKGGNRGNFERRLVDNISRLVSRSSGNSVRCTRINGRIILHENLGSDVRKGLSRTFGIANFSPAQLIETDLGKIETAVLNQVSTYLEENPLTQTFGIETRRSDKALPENSMEINRKIGSLIQSRFPSLKVNLDQPDLTVGIEVRKEQSLIWSKKIKGLGGLPVGANSKLLTLISGGLDSPIAALQVMKRGSPTSFVHFYGAPFVEEQVLRNVEDLVRIVNSYAPHKGSLYVVPFGKIQETVALHTNRKLRTILYRRLMFRIASSLAEKIGAKALVTGESLGQVASQTIENLATINEAAKIPVIRPLITHDKEEIIRLAKQFGTFETSTQPGVDCCTLFSDRHPVLKSKRELVEEQEARISLQELVQKALDEVQVFHF